MHFVESRCTRLTAVLGRRYPGQRQGDFGPPNGFSNRPPDMRARSHERPGMGRFGNLFNEFRPHFGEHRQTRQASANTEQIGRWQKLTELIILLHMDRIQWGGTLIHLYSKKFSPLGNIC